MAAILDSEIQFQNNELKLMFVHNMMQKDIMIIF